MAGYFSWSINLAKGWCLVTKMAKIQSNTNRSNIVTIFRNSKECDFVHSFRPVQYFSRVFGFMPFLINYDSSNLMYKPRLRTLDMLWSMILLLIYVSLMIVCYIQKIKIPYSTSQIINNHAWFALILTSSFGVIVIVMDTCNRFKIVNFLNKINQADRMVYSLSMYNFPSPFLLPLFWLAFQYSLFFDFVITAIQCSCRWLRLGFISITRKICNEIGGCAWW